MKNFVTCLSNTLLRNKTPFEGEKSSQIEFKSSMSNSRLFVASFILNCWNINEVSFIFLNRNKFNERKKKLYWISSEITLSVATRKWCYVTTPQVDCPRAVWARSSVASCTLVLNLAPLSPFAPPPNPPAPPPFRNYVPYHRTNFSDPPSPDRTARVSRPHRTQNLNYKIVNALFSAAI